MSIPPSVIELVKKVFEHEGFLLDDFKINYIDKSVPKDNVLWMDYGEIYIEKLLTKKKKTYQTGIYIGDNPVSWDEQLKDDLKNGYFD